MKISSSNKDITFNAYKCKRPKMSDRRGRFWDTWAYNTTLNGELINLWFEAGWGSSFYFEFQRQWYRAPWWNSGFPMTQNLVPEDIKSGTELRIVGKTIGPEQSGDQYGYRTNFNREQMI
jgi:hypothetical protein